VIVSLWLLPRSSPESPYCVYAPFLYPPGPPIPFLPGSPILRPLCPRSLTTLCLFRNYLIHPYTTDFYYPLRYPSILLHPVVRPLRKLSPITLPPSISPSFPPSLPSSLVLSLSHTNPPPSQTYPGNTYGSVSFETPGTGYFTPGPGATPYIGTVGKEERVEEVRVEILVVGRDVVKAAVGALRRYVILDYVPTLASFVGGKKGRSDRWKGGWEMRGREGVVS